MDYFTIIVFTDIKMHLLKYKDWCLPRENGLNWFEKYVTEANNKYEQQILYK